jgi:APA family basic amino acid/polyamine antiporter
VSRKHKLKRNLGLVLVTLYGLGNIVGAGIYALIGKVAGEAGNATPLAFILASVVAGLSALSFAELSSRQPYSEGVSAYVHLAFKKKWLSLVVGLFMSIATVVSAAALARAFGGYLQAATGLNLAIGAMIIILAFGLLASWGIAESTKIFALHTIIEIAGLLAILWFGRAELSHSLQNAKTMFDISTVGFGGLMSGVFLAFYAYIGIEDMVHLSEETKRTRYTMPVAIILAVIISTVLYFLITVVSINSIPISELQNSNAPLSLVFSKITSSPVWIITVIALTASAGGVLAHIISGSRLLYGMAEAGWLHKRLAIVHESRKTPSLAIAIVVVLSAVLAFFIDLTTLATITSFMILAVFLLVNVALAFLKVRKVKSAQSRISVPIVIPVLGMFSCLILLALQIIHLL